MLNDIECRGDLGYRPPLVAVCIGCMQYVAEGWGVGGNKGLFLISSFPSALLEWPDFFFTSPTPFDLKVDGFEIESVKWN